MAEGLPPNPNRNQKPNNEPAAREHYEAAFDAIDAEVQLFGAVAYRQAVTVYGEEAVGGNRIPRADNQPTINLDEVPVADLLTRVPEEEHEALTVLGIKSDIADYQHVFLTLDPACFVKDAQGEYVFNSASAVLAVTTEFSNGGYVSSTYEVTKDSREDPPKLTGGFMRMSDMGDEDIPTELEGEHERQTDPGHLAMLAAIEREFSTGPQDSNKEDVYKKLRERDAEEELGLKKAGDEAINDSRMHLTVSEAEAVAIVARHYSPQPEVGGQDQPPLVQ